MLPPFTQYTEDGSRSFLRNVGAHLWVFTKSPVSCQTFPSNSITLRFLLHIKANISVHSTLTCQSRPEQSHRDARREAGKVRTLYCKSYVSMIRLHTRTRSLQASIYGLGIISPTSAHTWKNVYLLAYCRFVGREKLPRRRLASRLAQWHHTIHRDHASRPSSVVDTTGNYRLRA
jgi:hypothetical protein